MARPCTHVAPGSRGPAIMPRPSQTRLAQYNRPGGPTPYRSATRHKKQHPLQTADLLPELHPCLLARGGNDAGAAELPGGVISTSPIAMSPRVEAQQCTDSLRVHSICLATNLRAHARGNGLARTARRRGSRDYRDSKLVEEGRPACVAPASSRCFHRLDAGAIPFFDRLLAVLHDLFAPDV